MKWNFLPKNHIGLWISHCMKSKRHENYSNKFYKLISIWRYSSKPIFYVEQSLLILNSTYFEVNSLTVQFSGQSITYCKYIDNAHKFIKININTFYPSYIFYALKLNTVQENI